MHLNNRLLLSLVIFSFTVMDKNAEAGSGTATASTSSAIDNYLILELFNTHRINGLSCNGNYFEPVPPLEWSEQLSVAAQMYSEALYANRSDRSFARRGGFDLSGVLEQLDYEYTSIYQSFSNAQDGFTEETFVNLILNDNRSCRQLMSSNYQDLGIARTNNFWVQLLAAPKIPHYWNTDSINHWLLIELVNQNRSQGARCGSEYFPPAGPVSWNDELTAAAQIHSNDMNANTFFSHTGSDNSSLADRVTSIGYKYSTIGENIAMGETQTEELVIEGWMNSPAHCRNIMQGRFTEMGVARSGIYWTQVFGRPRQ